MFEVEQFIDDCRNALKEQQAQSAIREVVARAVANPEQIIKALGEPKLAGIDKIYHADDLTILNLAWGPQMTLHPHNHNMWAVIGMYGGQEDNTFYRRGPEGLRQHGTKSLYAKDTIPLGKDIIHSVTNPLNQLTLALHVYGGDFFADGRSEWDPETLQEQPFDIEHSRAAFAESNRRLGGL
jgi:predicted metal-dependent enzyme (double-stranded beta helix superfamily)